MLYTQESLYQLRPNEFEELCAKVIKDIMPEVTDIEHVSGADDSGVDIIGKTRNASMAIEVKHKLKISKKDVLKIFNKLEESFNSPKHVVLMTSASMRDMDMASFRVRAGITYHVIGVDDILEVLNTTEIKKVELNHALKRDKIQKRQLFFSSFSIILVLVSMAISISEMFIQHKKPPLEQRIETVKTVIGNLKDLEIQLKDIKDDMIETQKAKLVIEEEYNKARELEKVTEKQLESVRNALQAQSWKDTMLQYFIGFVLGLASSIAGTIIISRFKQRQALRDE